MNFNLYALATFFPAFLTRYHGLSVGPGRLVGGRRIRRGWHRGRADRRRLGRPRHPQAEGRAHAFGRRRGTGGGAPGADWHRAAGRRRGCLHRPDHGRLRLSEYVLRPGVLGDSRHRGAGGARHHHGGLLSGDVSLRRILRTAASPDASAIIWRAALPMRPARRWSAKRTAPSDCTRPCTSSRFSRRPWRWRCTPDRAPSPPIWCAAMKPACAP